MINRIELDDDFEERHSNLGKITLFLRKIGFINIFISLFPNHVPYMHLSIKKIK